MSRSLGENMLQAEGRRPRGQCSRQFVPAIRPTTLAPFRSSDRYPAAPTGPVPERWDVRELRAAGRGAATPGGSGQVPELLGLCSPKTLHHL